MSEEDEDDQLLPTDVEYIRELSSCLFPDMESILWEGKVDSMAINDISLFLNEVAGVKRDRGLGSWAICLYYLGSMSYMAGCVSDEQATHLEFVIKSIMEGEAENVRHSNVLHQLVLCIHKIRTVLRTNVLSVAPEKCIHWHNIREEMIPHTTNEKWFAIRSELICSVIKDAIGTIFKPRELQSAVAHVGWAELGKSQFYKVGDNNPWPIKNMVFDENTQTNVDIPLLEAELVASTLSRERCIWIKQSKFFQIVQDVDVYEPSNSAYKNVIIKSCNPDFPPEHQRVDGNSYNFFEVFTGQSDIVWFGYRAAANTEFGKYCGAVNLMQTGCGGSDDLALLYGVEESNIAQGWGSINELYQPPSLREWFDYKPVDKSALPPGLVCCPFEFRDGSNDIRMTGVSVWSDLTSDHKPAFQSDEDYSSTPEPSLSSGSNDSPIYHGPRPSLIGGRRPLGPGNMPVGARTGVDDKLSSSQV